MAETKAPKVPKAPKALEACEKKPTSLQLPQFMGCNTGIPSFSHGLTGRFWGINCLFVLVMFTVFLNRFSFRYGGLVIRQTQGAPIPKAPDQRKQIPNNQKEKEQSEKKPARREPAKSTKDPKDTKDPKGKHIELEPIYVKESRTEPESAEAVETGFTSIISAYANTLEGMNTAQALSRTVGVGTRRSGGLGDYTAVLIRGSSAQQVGVFIDGVPLSGGYGATIDLSLFPLMSFSRVEVFRGMLPSEFGSEGIGGGINLIPETWGNGAAMNGNTHRDKRASVIRVFGGLGSYGLSRIGAAASGIEGALSYSANVSLQSWSGDFPYYSDNGTPYNTQDDHMVKRLNNDTLLVGGLAWAGWRISPLTRISVLESFGFKSKGLPGIGHNQAVLTRLESLHQILDFKIHRRSFLHNRVDAMVRANFQIYRQRYQDPMGELGIGSQDQVDTNYSLGLISRFTWAVDMHNMFALIPEWRIETYSGRDLTSENQDNDEESEFSILPSSRRYRFGVALRDRILLAKERVRLTPAIRFDALYSIVDGDTRGGRALQNSYQDFISPRLGVRISPHKNLDIKGNVGKYFRAPTLMELFGDRGTAVGNPELESETGVGGDLGVVYTNKKVSTILTKLYAQTALFGRRVSNLIGWVQNSQRTAMARNIAEAQVLGTELAGRACFALHDYFGVVVAGNYTLLWTKNMTPEPLIDGNQLPGRPLHEIGGRVDISVEWKRFFISAHYAIEHISQSYLDEANLFLPVPGRTLHDVGLLIKPWIERVTLAATFKNIGNLRVENVNAPSFTDMDKIPRALADYGGFPLPGWTFYVTVIWESQ